MNINPYARLIEYQNLTEDFKMPHQVYGGLSKEVMLEKYMKLTNKPTHLLEVRYIYPGW
ncbi:hypothetical protein CAL7716_043910 [Calothrix sp. PCC 7716]|nr:hypothetical protein CAL7716_043910 [Calothrix sp. PCC 7716]